MTDNESDHIDCIELNDNEQIIGEYEIWEFAMLRKLYLMLTEGDNYLDQVIELAFENFIWVLCIIKFPKQFIHFVIC